MDVGEGGGIPSALDNPCLETKHNIPGETRASYAFVTTKSSKSDDSFRGGPSLDLEDVEVLDDDCLIEDSGLFPTIRHLLDAPLKDHASFAWKGLHIAMQELRPSFSWILGCDSQPNRLLWEGNVSGTYSVRSGYFYLCRPPSHVFKPSPIWKAIKQFPTLPKVHIFAWRLGQDCLLIGGRIRASDLGPGGFPDAAILSASSSTLDWLVDAAGLLSCSNLIFPSCILSNIYYAH
ncbi:hypothetical protein V6N11_080234 [Hibiscus sabdariffa]|uniref:Reverse transcriptase zinc-binding domain-containing protein n=1 Tax=Hibiscus sabdariffa TaxID=183260 RepID=A0ABR2R729_9ROSI